MQKLVVKYEEGSAAHERTDAALTEAMVEPKATSVMKMLKAGNAEAVASTPDSKVPPPPLH